MNLPRMDFFSTCPLSRLLSFSPKNLTSYVSLFVLACSISCFVFRKASFVSSRNQVNFISAELILSGTNSRLVERIAENARCQANDKKTWNKKSFILFASLEYLKSSKELKELDQALADPLTVILLVIPIFELEITAESFLLALKNSFDNFSNKTQNLDYSAFKARFQHLLYCDSFIDFSLLEAAFAKIGENEPVFTEEFEPELISDEPETLKFDSEVLTMFVSSDNMRLVALCFDGSMRILDLSEERQCWKVDAKVNCFTPAIKKNENILELFAVSKSSCWIYKIKDKINEDISCCELFPLEDRMVTCMCLSHDNELLFTGSWSKLVRVYAVRTGKCLQTLAGHSEAVFSIQVSLDDQWIFSCATRERVFCIWNWMKSSSPIILEGSGITSLLKPMLLPLNDFLFTGGEDEKIRIWNVSRKDCLNVLVGHSTAITSLTISSDGYLLFSGSTDSTVRVWDWVLGTCLKELTQEKVGNFNPDNAIIALVYSSDRLFASFQNRTLSVWTDFDDCQIEDSASESCDWS